MIYFFVCLHLKFLNGTFRYFLNHMRDPERQEGLDLLLSGRFDPRFE